MIDPATTRNVADTSTPLADLAGAVAQQSLDAVRERTRQLREQTQHASDRTVDYIRREPVKSVLMAAAGGAAVAALLGLMFRSHGHR